MPHEINSPLHRVFMQNVKARREELSLTQAEVAAKMRVSQPTYANIELGRNTPTIEVIEKVARALDTSPLQLLLPLEVTVS